MSAVTWAVAADFDRNGSYETDLTGDIELPGSGIQIDRGFGKDGIYQISKVSITVTNRDGTYVFDNSSSALYGKMKAGVPIRVFATHNAISYTLWTGYIQTYRMSGYSSGTVPTCTFECTDLAGYLSQQSPLNVLVGTRRTDEAYAAVATAAGLLGTDVHFTGIQELPIHWVRSSDALTAMAQVQQSEMGGQWFIDALGVIQGQSRSERLGISVDATWGDGSDIYPVSASVEVSEEDVISKCGVQANVFVEDADEQVIFTFSRNSSNPVPDSIYLEPLAYYGPVSLDYPAPALTVAELVAGEDYTANSAIDGSGTDLTANLRVTNVEEGVGFNLTLKNTSETEGLYVTKFEKSGLASNYVPDRPIFTYSYPIPGDKTERGISVQLPFADDSGKPQDFAVQLVRTYRYPYPRLTLNFLPGDDVALAAMLSVELGDLIQYRDTDVTTLGKSYSNDFWYVDHIRQTIPPDLAGATFGTTVEMVPAYLFRNLDAIVYDKFERDDSVGDLGTSTSLDVWTSSGFDIVGGAVVGTGSGIAQANLGTGVTDCVVEVQMSGLTAGGPSNSTGIVYRQIDGQNLWLAVLDEATSAVTLYKVVIGSITTVDTVAWTPTPTAELRVIIQATRHRVWVNGLLVIDVEDNTHQNGTGVGIFSDSLVVMFDEFYAQGLNGGAQSADSEYARTSVRPSVLPMPLRAPGKRRRAS